jgi:hypothetical protein
MAKPPPSTIRDPRENRIPFGPIKGVEWVTPHCFRRFIERAHVKGTVGQIMRNLESWLERSHPADLKPEARVKKILNHGGTPSTYWMIGPDTAKSSWILVQSGKTLVTVHQNDSLEWVRRPEDSRK